MNFNEMVDGLFHFYETTIKRKKNKLYEYNGNDITSNCILATSPTIKQQLSKDEFEFRVNDKNQDPIKLLINAAIQLGVQQGINMCTESPSRYMENKEYDNMMDKIISTILKR